MSGDEEQFVKEIKAQLDRQAESLDSRTLTRLRQARAAAQAEGAKRGWRWQPAAAFASVAVLAAAIWIAMPAGHDGTPRLAALDDLELLATNDDLELYEEIEFYQWLETQDEQG